MTTATTRTDSLSMRLLPAVALVGAIALFGGIALMTSSGGWLGFAVSVGGLLITTGALMGAVALVLSHTGEQEPVGAATVTGATGRGRVGSDGLRVARSALSATA